MRSARMVGPFSSPAGYDKHTHGWFGRLHTRVVADVVASGLPGGARVLDVGTGPGRIPLAVAQGRPQWSVDAVDLDPAMIEYARRQDPGGRVTFSVGDVAALPYPDGSFDLVVSSLSQHHWTNVEGGVRELRRVLRPGGQLWVYDVRFALRRAQRAAQTCFGPDAVRRDTVPTGRTPLRIFARLVATLEPDRVVSTTVDG
jgi:ubiquinone/menaquinone biosynthesis C-methylase UbiE